MTFEELQKANQAIVTTSLEHKNKKGKTVTNEYAPVNQRIKAFRMVYPNGAIETSIISLQDGIIVMRAEIFDEDHQLIGTGTASEKESSSFINKTSYIENCETSAVGRALGMCGFGVDTSISSAEEAQNAITEQIKEEHDEGLRIEAKKKTVSEICDRHGISIDDLCNVNGLEWDNVTEEQLENLIKSLTHKYGDDA